MAVLLTDGRSQESERTVAAAERLRRADVRVIVVGVSGVVNKAELRDVSSYPHRRGSDYFTVLRFISLGPIIDAVVASACVMPTAPPPGDAGRYRVLVGMVKTVKIVIRYATFLNSMHNIIMHNIIMHNIIMHNIIMHNIIMHNIIMHDIIMHNIIMHNIIMHNMIMHNIIMHNIIMHNIIMHNIIMHNIIMHKIIMHNIIMHNIIMHNVISCII